MLPYTGYFSCHYNFTNFIFKFMNFIHELLLLQSVVAVAARENLNVNIQFLTIVKI